MVRLREGGFPGPRLVGGRARRTTGSGHPSLPQPGPLRVERGLIHAHFFLLSSLPVFFFGAGGGETWNTLNKAISLQQFHVSYTFVFNKLNCALCKIIRDLKKLRYSKLQAGWFSPDFFQSLRVSLRISFRDNVWVWALWGCEVSTWPWKPASLSALLGWALTGPQSFPFWTEGEVGDIKEGEGKGSRKQESEVERRKWKRNTHLLCYFSHSF